MGNGSSSNGIDKHDGPDIGRANALLRTGGFLASLVVVFLAGFYLIGPHIGGAGQPQTSPRSELSSSEKDWGQAPMPPPPARRTPPASADKSGVQIEELPPGAASSKAGGSESTVMPEATQESPQPEVSPMTGPDESPPSVTAQENRKYFVQAGVFASRANAETAASELEDQGYAASIKSVFRDGKTSYRVVVGRPRTLEKAKELAAELRDSGKDVTISPAD